MNRRLKMLMLAVLLFIISISLTGADYHEIEVFVGHPTVRVMAAGVAGKNLKGKIPLEKISPEKKEEFACVIVKRGNKYFWKSRDGYEVHKRLWGTYTEFRRLDRLDYVRIANPNIRDNSLVDTLMYSGSGHHYVEHLTTGLASVNYWGRVVYEDDR